MTIQKIAKTKSDIESILTDDTGQVSISDETLVPISALGIENGYIIDGCNITEPTDSIFIVQPGTVAVIDEATGNPHIIDVLETDLGGFTGGTIDVYIEYIDGDVRIDLDTANVSFGDNAFRIARIGSSQAGGRWHLKESDGTISFPNESAIDSADSRGNLQVGTTVLDRETNTKYVITP
jgi:hypothetical protein